MFYAVVQYDMHYELLLIFLMLVPLLKLFILGGREIVFYAVPILVPPDLSIDCTKKQSTGPISYSSKPLHSF